MWITNGPDADTFLIYARPIPPPVRVASVPSSSSVAPELQHAQKLDKLGMRGSGTCELVLEGASAAANLLGVENGGVRAADERPDYERVVAGGPLGLMAAALDVVLPTCTSASSSASRSAPSS
jgi:isovaleryl-CoA dehydrogenase